MCEYDRYCRCRDMVVIKKKGMVIKMKNTVSLKLVEKAAKGNREAFGELIIMHQEYRINWHTCIPRMNRTPWMQCRNALCAQ